MNDDQLKRMLDKSRPPSPSTELDERVMRAYREFAHPPWWLRTLRARIAVPLPAAVAFLALVVVLALWRIPATPPKQAYVEMAIPACEPAPDTSAKPQTAGSEPPAAREVAAAREKPAPTAIQAAWSPVEHPEWRIVQ